MIKYKYADETGLVINDQESGRFGIHKATRFWEDYQDWLAEGNVTEAFMRKEDAFEEVIQEVNEKNRQENLKLFPYNGQNYVADQESIQGTQNYINGCLHMETCLLSDPIPTPNGVWKTADKVDGEPVYVAYSNGEFLMFADTFYKRSSDNFGVKEFHKLQLRNMLINPVVTVEDILAYDYSGGWR